MSITILCGDDIDQDLKLRLISSDNLDQLTYTCGDQLYTTNILKQPILFRPI